MSAPLADPVHSLRVRRRRRAARRRAVTTVTTYALLVGIDAYLPPLTPLYGCRNDIAALETYLRARADGDLDLRMLLDADATRDTVIAGVPRAPRPGRRRRRRPVRLLRPRQRGAGAGGDRRPRAERADPDDRAPRLRAAHRRQAAPGARRQGAVAC